MRTALALVIAVVAGCAPSLPSSYHCAGDAQCVYAGAQGRCEPTGACSFPDASCSDGRRYGQFGPPGLAGACVSDGAAGADMASGAPSDGGVHAITRVGASSVPAGNRTTVLLPAPTGLVAGDVVLVSVFTPDAQSTITPPSGWTPHADLHGAIGGEFHAVWYVHVAAGGEPAWSFTLGAAASITASAVAYRGVDGLKPVDASSTNQFEGSAFIAPSITTTRDGDELVTAFVQAQQQTLAWNPPGGMQAAVSNGAIGIFDVAQPTAGATGDKQASLGGLGLPGIGAVDFVALTPN